MCRWEKNQNKFKLVDPIFCFLNSLKNSSNKNSKLTIIFTAIVSVSELLTKKQVWGFKKTLITNPLITQYWNTSHSKRLKAPADTVISHPTSLSIMQDYASRVMTQNRSGSWEFMVYTNMRTLVSGNLHSVEALPLLCLLTMWSQIHLKPLCQDS